MLGRYQLLPRPDGQRAAPLPQPPVRLLQSHSCRHNNSRNSNTSRYSSYRTSTPYTTVSSPPMLPGRAGGGAIGMFKGKGMAI